MGIMEERLTLTESRVSSMIASQRTAALVQQRSNIEQGDQSFVSTTSTAKSAPPQPSTTVPAAAVSTSSSGPSVSDLRTIQLRVMCRQRGLDSTGTEAELLKRLNDNVGAPSPARPVAASLSSTQDSFNFPEDSSEFAEFEHTLEEMVAADEEEAETERHLHETMSDDAGRAVQYYAEEDSLGMEEEEGQEDGDEPLEAGQYDSDEDEAEYRDDR